MREHYEPLYPNLRFESIVHTFNEPIPDFAPPPAPSTPLSLAFQGNLNESNIDATCRLAEIVHRLPTTHSPRTPARPIGFLPKWA